MWTDLTPVEIRDELDEKELVIGLDELRSLLDAEAYRLRKIVKSRRVAIDLGRR